MEREDEHQNTIHHITHLHPLKLTDLRKHPPAAPHRNPTCYACRQPCADSAYVCAQCGYALDPTCARLPQTLRRHPAHPAHPLTLLLLPAYAPGAFRCSACSHNGQAFSFHCAQCEFDLHLPCAALPEVLNHRSHPHPLRLFYEDPDGPGRSFICDLCRGTSDSSCQWFYLCRACNFSGHISCFMSETLPQTTATGGWQQAQQANPAGELLAMQRKLQASMIRADLSVMGARGAADLAGGPYHYTYCNSAPMPSQYAAMASNIMMNNLALMSLNNSNNSSAMNHQAAAGGGSAGPPAGGNVARFTNKSPRRPW